MCTENQFPITKIEMLDQWLYLLLISIDRCEMKLGQPLRFKTQTDSHKLDTYLCKLACSPKLDTYLCKLTFSLKLEHVYLDKLTPSIPLHTALKGP